MTERRVMSQSAPYPTGLESLVSKCTYKPDWRVWLEHEERGQGSVGLTLTIQTNTVNSYRHDMPMHVRHLFIVPAASYDERSWQRWLFDRFIDVETHEAMEFLTIGDVKPYAPSHGPGNDPYLVREVGTDLDRRIAFTGRINS